MSKVKLTRQARYSFSTRLPIRVSDLNYGGHLGYDKILTLAHQARIEMLGRMGVTELDLGDGSTGLVAGDAALNYLGEGFLNDIMLVEIQAVEIGAFSFRLAHRFTNLGSGAEVALAEIGLVGFNFQQRHLSKLPEAFIRKLKDFGNKEES